MLFDPRWDDGTEDDKFVGRYNALAERCNALNYATRDAHRTDLGVDLQQALYELNCAIVFLRGWRLDAAEECLRDAEWAFLAARPYFEATHG
jgi:hypothetical protein